MKMQEGSFFQHNVRQKGSQVPCIAVVYPVPTLYFSKLQQINVQRQTILPQTTTSIALEKTNITLTPATTVQCGVSSFCLLRVTGKLK